MDEIWFLNNLNPRLPFSLNARVLERIDPCSGKTTGQWDWPDNTIDDTMSHSYRFYITGGLCKWPANTCDSAGNLSHNVSSGI